MAGIYIHIPFCASKCGYCGFYSLPSLKLKERFLEALRTEIVERKEYLSAGLIAGEDPQSPAFRYFLLSIISLFSASRNRSFSFKEGSE